MHDDQKFAVERLGDPARLREVFERQRDADAKLEMLVLDAISAHPKRRGELRAEYTRRILRLAREGK